MHRNGYFELRCKFRHRRSIRLPRFPVKSAKYRWFGDVFRWFLHFIYRMSAIFLLPVCLNYWPRKYTTRVDPHVDNSHQVWSPYTRGKSGPALGGTEYRLMPSACRLIVRAKLWNLQFRYLVSRAPMRRRSTQWVKKTRHQTLAHNFTKYWPIFKILPLLDSVGNL